MIKLEKLEKGEFFEDAFLVSYRYNKDYLNKMRWGTGIDQEMRLILLLSPECYQVRSIKGCTSLTRDIMILIQKRLY